MHEQERNIRTRRISEKWKHCCFTPNLQTRGELSHNPERTGSLVYLFLSSKGRIYFVLAKSAHPLVLIITWLQLCIISWLVTHGCSTHSCLNRSTKSNCLCSPDWEWVKTVPAVRVEEWGSQKCARDSNNHRKCQAYRNNYSVAESTPRSIPCPTKKTDWKVKNWMLWGPAMAYISDLFK